MAQREIHGGRLFDLYARYVGEPQSRKDVYGYWTLIVGYLVGFGGILVYLLSPAGGPSNFFVREVAITLAAVGLPLGLLGIVLMLPVAGRGIQTSVVGTVVALGAVGWFVTVYPANWGVGTPDYSSAVIAVYFVGVLLVASVAALVPVLTGEKSFFFTGEHVREGDHPAVMIGEATRGGLFAVYNDGARWTWRLLEQGALAGGVEEYLSRLETEEAVERVREKVRQARLLEITHAAFRLYETADDGVRWLLMREDGTAIAEGGGAFETREAAEESANLLKERGPVAPVLDIDGAAFDVHRNGDGWRWDLLDESRDVVASAPTPVDSREAADATVERVRELAGQAGELTVEQYAAELFEDTDVAGDGDTGDWRWRLLTATDDTVAGSERSWSTRREAEDAVHAVLDGLDDVGLRVAGEPAYEVYADGDEYRWRLVTAADAVGARSHGGFASATAAEESAGRMRANIATADVVVNPESAFEIFQDPDGWRWRLVDDERAQLATSATAFPTHEDAQDAVDRLRSDAAAAELIEFDTAAFQLYEADTGEWRWRLIDEDGNVMADSGEDYGSRGDAAAAMTTLKQNAPDAELLEIETAAFELFEDDTGGWNVRLVDETGQELAEDRRGHASRSQAREAMETFRDHAAEAPVRVMDRAAFQIYPNNGDAWWWRFVHPDGTVVADGVTGHATRDEAGSAVDALRESAGDATVLDVGDLAVRLEEADDGWRWTLVDRDRDVVAHGQRTHPSREAAEAAVADLSTHAPETPVFDIEEATFRLRPTDAGWRWELLDENRNPLAVGPEPTETRQRAQSATSRVARLGPDAGMLDFDQAAFELYPDDDGWHWRLIDEDDLVIAQSTAGKPDREAARAEAEAVADVVGEASVLEVDGAAFELHEEDGAWRFRLVAEDGDPIGESVESYPTREDAREALRTVQEFAPEAATSVAE